MVFKTIVADPPWDWGSRCNRGSGHKPFFPTMSIDRLCAMKVPADKKAHLWLWGVSKKMDWAYIVARAWGFEPVNLVTWCKRRPGLGQFQTNTEHVLMARRGGAIGNPFGKTGGTWFDWSAGRCVEKPDDFYKLVEKVSPGPYLDMFARKKREGWSVWGNEVESDVTIVA